MLNENKYDDAIFDRNLATIGPSLSLPSEPTARQEAGWKSPAKRSTWSRRFSGVTHMNKRRWLTISGVGGAIAAAVIIAITLGTPSHHATVKADTIFAGLHDALGRAFKLTYENLGLSGVRSSGTLIVLNSETPAGGNPDLQHSDRMYWETRFQGEPGSENAGLDIEAVMSFVESGDNWAYVKTQQLPAAMTAQQPFLAWLAGLANDGLLIELPNQSANVGSPIPPGPNTTPPVTTSNTTTVGGITTTVTESTQTMYTMKPSMTFSIGVTSSPDGQLTPEQQEQMVQQAMANANNGSNNVGGNVSLQLSGSESPLGTLLDKVITGQADPADLQNMVTQLQASADSVVVEQTEPGLHVLTATGIDVGEITGGGGSAPATDATLRVTYRESLGVESAELLHVGANDGTIRFERAHVPADDPRFDKARFSSNPDVRHVDLNDWSNLFSLFGGSNTTP